MKRLLSLALLNSILVASAFGADDVSELKRSVESLKQEVQQLRQQLNNSQKNNPPTNGLKREDFGGRGAATSGRATDSVPLDLGGQQLDPKMLQQLQEQLKDLQKKKNEHDKMLEEIDKL